MEQKYIKLKDWAKIMGLHYNTAYKYFHQGKIPDSYQDKDTGTIFIKMPKEIKEDNNSEHTAKAVLYARVSSSTNKASLDGQISRMKQYAETKGYSIISEYKEIASGLNENRRMLNKILERKDFNILIVEHKDRLTRFGYEYISKILKNKGQRIEIINATPEKEKTAELLDDFVSIVTSFCGRIYGSNRKKKTQEIIDKIQREE